MLASLWTYLSHAFWFNTGANVWQWVTSLVAVAGWGMYFHARFGEDRCEHCWRKGTVPVSGAVHSHCKRHALEHGTTHT